MVKKIEKIRHESFGGIAFSEEIPATIFLDKNFMLSLGYKESPLWNLTSNYLSAPLVVHFHLTNKCFRRCPYCYTSSGPEEEEEFSLAEVKKIIDILSEMKVFTIAFGGGEAFLREDLFEIARYTREKGIVPNITTSGMGITEKNEKECQIFGSIFLSIDLSEEILIQNQPCFKALQLLRKNKVKLGINFVVHKRNYVHLEDISRFAAKNKIKHIIFLRLKPFGRGKEFYNENKLSLKENIEFFPLLKRLTRKYNLRPMIDCSFSPMIYWHRPKKKLLEFFGFMGCSGGNYFITIDHKGFVKSCSFCQKVAGKAEDLKLLWKDSLHFQAFRNWVKNAPPPCNHCEYLEFCGGGCHAITEALTDNFHNPDPECPRVVEFEIGKNFNV